MNVQINLRLAALVTRCRGFTLIEVVVTLAVAAILMSVAVPSFQQMMETNRIAAITNDFSRALQLTRSEAVTRGTLVTMCKSDDINDATPTCNNSAAWNDGWIIFADLNSNGAYDAAEDTVIRVGQPNIQAAAITTDSKLANFISFNAVGEPRANGAGNGTFSVCIAPDQRDIVVSVTGRVRIDKGTCTGS